MKKGDLIFKLNGKPFKLNGCMFAEFVEMTPNNNPELPEVVTVREEDGCFTGHDPKSVASLQEIAKNAQEAFWKEVVKSVPSIETGDMAPDHVRDFDYFCQSALRKWIWANSN